MILQFLLNYFLTEYKNGSLKPIYDLLEQNSFDVFKALKNARLENLAPIISAFINSAPSNENSFQSSDFAVGTSPILSIADKEVVSTLNQYFSN